MRSYALFAIIAATLFFVISLGLTAKDLSSASTLLNSINDLGFDNSNPFTFTSPVTSSTSTAATADGTSTENTSTEDTLTEDTSTATSTSSLDTETVATFSNPLTTATDDGSIDSALASYSSYLASYSSYLATVNGGGLFGGDGSAATTTAADLPAGGALGGGGVLTIGRRAMQPTPVVPVMQKRAPQPTPAPAGTQRRHTPTSPMQKRASPPTSLSQAKSRYSAILAFLALLLVTYVALIGAGIAFVVLLHRATTKHHHAQAAYLNAGPSTPAGTPHHDLSHGVDEAAYARTGVFKSFFVAIAALTVVLTLFGVIAFALIGAFIGFGDGILAASVAFWVLSVVAAAASCGMLLLDRRTSEREEPIGGLDGTGEKTTAFPSTTAAASASASQQHNYGGSGYNSAGGSQQHHEYNIAGLRRKSSPVVDQAEFGDIGQQRQSTEHHAAAAEDVCSPAQHSPSAPASGYTSEMQQQQQPSFPSAGFAGNDGPYPSFSRRGPLPNVPSPSPAVGQYYRQTFDEQTGVTLRPVNSNGSPREEK